METPVSSKRERKELRRREKQEQLLRERRKRAIWKNALWFFAIVILAGMTAGVIKLASPGRENTYGGSVEAVAESEWIRGNSGASVTLIEYSDFQCPACASSHPLLKELSREFENDMRFVYRHFPLKAVHQNAELASRASEAAGRQGKFWEMHDTIFENQQQWANTNNPEGLFTEYAEALGLDIVRFKEDMESEEVRAAVNEDIKSGENAGVNATPTFFLNGKKIKNPRSYEDFKEIVTRVLR